MLPGGVLSTALTCWLLIRTRERNTTRTWPLFWLASGLLPWLNAKFAITTIVFALGGSGLVWRLTHADRGAEARAAAWAMPLVMVGPLLLATFNLLAFGSVFGQRGLGE